MKNSIITKKNKKAYTILLQMQDLKVPAWPSGDDSSLLGGLVGFVWPVCLNGVSILIPFWFLSCIVGAVVGYEANKLICKRLYKKELKEFKKQYPILM